MAHKKGQGSTRNGRDWTLFAKIDGVVKFERHGKSRTRVAVYTAAEAAETAARNVTAWV